MSDGIYISGPVAFMEASGSAVYFSKSPSTGGVFSIKGTAAVVKKIQNSLEVAYWGEDNRFPQNIENQMAWCGTGKAALGWKANALYGAGIIPGKIVDYKLEENNTISEVFEPLKRKSETEEIFRFLNNRQMFRFFLEYLLDWVWYGNCFPEAIFSNDCTKITHFVHQESNDCRFKQMNDDGIIDTVYISKLWGMAKNQFAKFDPDKKVEGLVENPRVLTNADRKYIKQLDCIDMYDYKNSAKEIADKLKNNKGLKSAIFPTNYPSPNKTYYQVPAWDGARLSGWVEIACKIPSILKAYLKKGQKIQFHIEIPETYFENKFTKEIWREMNEAKRKEAREDLLKRMDKFLTDDKSDFSTFTSFFDVEPREKTEYGRIKITAIESKYNLDKEILGSSAADVQILTAMGLHPTLIGAGTVGTGTQRTGGSDQREAFLIYNALLNLERQVAFEPLYLARDFNEWGEDIVFRVIDTKLTTLNQNKGTEKTVS